jgi:hypothetical protein
MTQDEALEKMREIVEGTHDDPESTHPDLDDVLCAVLRSLGYDKLIDYYEAQERWFS